MVRTKLIGDRAFYKSTMSLALPIMIQTGITQFVNMLDNIMIGRVGTVEMSGVSIANNLIFVFNLCIFGMVSGAGIFGAQFFGKGDRKGLRNTFRFKIICSALLTIIGSLIFTAWGEPLIDLYLRGDADITDKTAALSFAQSYLLVMLFGLLPFALSQCYSTTLRETGQTVVSMVSGVIAVSVNLILNYVLIYGKFGAPRLGVVGAAIATVISRFVELAVIAVWTHTHKSRNPFIKGAFRSLRVPMSLVRQIAVKGLPLMLNETMWSMGVVTLNQCYSTRGLAVVAANQMCSTFSNVFSTAFLSVGSAIGIILGQMLGAGKSESVLDTARKLTAFSVAVSVMVSAIFAAFSGIIPQIYNSSDNVRRLAMRLMQICALTMPLDAFANASYFTLRSGGKTFITILFDSCFVWAIQFPVAFVLSRFTDMPILYMYAVCQSLNIIKCIVGYIMVNKGVWIRNIVEDQNDLTVEEPQYAN